MNPQPSIEKKRGYLASGGGAATYSRKHRVWVVAFEGKSVELSSADFARHDGPSLVKLVKAQGAPVARA